jgi:hypothetical protein
VGVLLGAVIALGMLFATTAAAISMLLPPKVTASGEITPHKLPASHPVPVRLQIGFTSESSEGSVPELDRVAFEISRSVTFQTAGLPSCPISDLLYQTLRYGCEKSLVGHGSVTSEIALPGQAPVTVTGHLSAYYAFAAGEPHILAQVVTGEPLSLVYVIPFAIEKAQRPFGTRMIVRKMRQIHGICIRPDCGQTYTLKGIYSRISAFSISLHRIYRRHGKRASLVNSIDPCSRAARRSQVPLLRTMLRYVDGARASEEILQGCRAQGKP